jgi:XapX domain-containing protein
MYLVSLGTGVLVGVIYSLLHVRSPAPPVVALVGLLGMLIGEQVIPVGKKLIVRSGLWVVSQETQGRLDPPVSRLGQSRGTGGMDAPSDEKNL